MKNKALYVVLPIWLLLLSPASAQDMPDINVQGTVYGQVVDMNSRQHVEFATVALYSMIEDKVVEGTLTDEKGQFILDGLDLGIYDLEISFVGYKKTKINRILITPKKSEIYLGEILLEPSVQQLDEVVVSGEKEEVIFKADRKVINIEKNLSAEGGTLVEALENQPSIKTDMEGNMTLRGSPNFTVLVNGKPTALRGSDALQQIPANTVESVEIITNPSAKFDSEGEVGIINVITRKDFSDGFSGTINGSGGFTSNFIGRYSTDANFQLIRKNLTFSTGFNIRYSPIEGEATRYIENFTEAGKLIRESDMNVGVYRSNYTFTSGLAYQPNTNNTFNWDLNLGRLTFERQFDSRTIAVVDVMDSLLSYAGAENERDFISTSLGYEHLFDVATRHKFNINLFVSSTATENKDDLLEQSTYATWKGSDLITEQLSQQEGNDHEVRLNLDYVRPLGRSGLLLETGYQGRYEITDQDQSIAVTYPDNSSQTKNSITLIRNIHAGYIQVQGVADTWSYQIGLRPEYTDRQIDQTEVNANTEYFNLFPSANVSYALSRTDQFKVGYSMRINRPNINQLNPYLQFIDEKNTRRGNIDLLPEYVHSFEAAYTKQVFPAFFSAEVFYRQTQDKMSPVWTVEEEDRLLLSYSNLEKDHSFGTEIMASMPVTKWWRLSGSTSLYRYNIKGDVSGEDVNNTSNSWNVRLGSTFRLSATKTTIQFNAIYNSDVASAQGTREGFFATMLAVKQQLLKDKLNTSLQVRDVFSTMRFSNDRSSEFFINEMEFLPYTPIVSVNLNFRFNSYKKKKNINPSDINELDFQNDFEF